MLKNVYSLWLHEVISKGICSIFSCSQQFEGVTSEKNVIFVKVTIENGSSKIC